MITRNHFRWAVFGSFLLFGSSPKAAEEGVALADVPASVIDAATAAVEGIQITSAEVEVEDGETVYELEGTADGVDYEIEITADGRVLEVESDDRGHTGSFLRIACPRVRVTGGSIRGVV